MQQIQVVRPPKHRLSTFGTSDILYQLVTDVPGLPDRSRVRMGRVTAAKPQIITPRILKERFEGFGEVAQEYADSLIAQYGEALKGLEYHFRNEPQNVRVELVPPSVLIAELTKDFDRQSQTRSAIIKGTDKLWELSIMKFIVEETLSSFTSNVNELHERGFFEEDVATKRQEREIQQLIQKAKTDRALVPVLGKKLKEYGLFEQFQDEFFQLIR